MVEHPAWYLWDLGQAAQLPQDPPGSSGTTQDPTAGLPQPHQCLWHCPEPTQSPEVPPRHCLTGTVCVPAMDCVLASLPGCSLWLCAGV